MALAGSLAVCLSACSAAAPSPTGSAKPPFGSSGTAAAASASSTTSPASPPSPPQVSQSTVALSEPVPGAAARQVSVALFAPPASSGPYPLVVFSPGYDIPPSVYDPLLVAWARAGYVVAEAMYPYTAPGGPGGLDESDILYHPRDLAFVISSLTGPGATSLSPVASEIEPHEVAVAGHSDGGDVSLALVAAPCCRYVAVQAALILSGAELASFGHPYYSGASPVPIMVTQGTGDTINPPPCSAQLYDAAPDPRYYLSLTGASHLPPYEGRGAAAALVTRATTAFLNSYLKAEPGPLQAMVGATDSVGSLTASAPVAIPPGGCPGAPAQ